MVEISETKMDSNWSTNQYEDQTVVFQSQEKGCFYQHQPYNGNSCRLQCMGQDDSSYGQHNVTADQQVAWSNLNAISNQAVSDKF